MALEIAFNALEFYSGIFAHSLGYALLTGQN